MKSRDCPYCNRYQSPFARLDKECIHTCGSCGYHDKRVECFGIFYCPNPLCRACGAGWIADGLKQKDIPGTNEFSVDGDELHAKQVAHVMSMRDAKLLAFMRERYPEFMAIAPLPPVVVDHDRGDEQETP